MRTFYITATWDEEAGVWVAESNDVPGLATEAATQEELVAKLEVMIPELLEANSHQSPMSHDVMIPELLEANSQRNSMPEYVMQWHSETRLRLRA